MTTMADRRTPPLSRKKRDRRRAKIKKVKLVVQLQRPAYLPCQRKRKGRPDVASNKDANRCRNRSCCCCGRCCGTSRHLAMNPLWSNALRASLARERKGPVWLQTLIHKHEEKSRHEPQKMLSPPNRRQAQAKTTYPTHVLSSHSFISVSCR